MQVSVIYFIIFYYIFIFNILLGSCMIYQTGYYTGDYESATHSDGSFQTNGTLTMELNMNTQTLHYIVNGKLMPHYVSNIPTSVYFYV
jgi:hypothetical protein